MKLLRFTALFQSIYFFLTGIWPLLHIHSFMMITDLKTDLWLVRTVGFLILSVSLAIFTAFIKKEINTSIAVLGISSDLFLGFIDIYYSFKNIIPDIYLADAFIEALIITLWLISFKHIRSQA